MAPKLGQNQKSEVTKTIERKIFTNTWVDPKTVSEPYHDPKNSPLEPQKVKNDPKIKSKLKVRMKENIENKSCLTTWVQPKTVFEPYPDFKGASNFLQLQISSTSNFFNLKFLQISST